MPDVTNDDTVQQAEPEPLSITDTYASDESQLLSEMNMRLARMEKTLDAQTHGINTIGEMMNSVAEVFDDLAAKVKQGGIGGLISGLMGGPKNG